MPRVGPVDPVPHREQNEIFRDLLNRRCDVLAAVALAQGHNLLTHDAGAFEVADDESVVANAEMLGEGFGQRRFAARG